MPTQVISHTHRDGTRSTYILQPGSPVPMQIAALKPLKPTKIKADRRGYPKYKPGMSTAEYVALYEDGNGGHLTCAGFWQTLNTRPAAGYTGIDSVEHGDFDLMADEPAPALAPMPEPAAPKPAPRAADHMTAPLWQVVAQALGVPMVETDTEAAAMSAACLARFGSADPMACRHLYSFPDWHRATLASLRPSADVAIAAVTLERLTNQHAYCADRRAAIESGRRGDPAALAYIIPALQRLAEHGRGLERSESARALAELAAAGRVAAGHTTAGSDDARGAAPSQTLAQIMAEAPTPCGSGDAAPPSPPVSGDACDAAPDRQDTAVIHAELDQLTAAAKARLDRVTPGGVGWGVWSELDVMTAAERQRRHELVQALPTFSEDRAAAADRVRQRVAARRARRAMATDPDPLTLTPEEQAADDAAMADDLAERFGIDVHQVGSGGRPPRRWRQAGAWCRMAASRPAHSPPYGGNAWPPPVVGSGDGRHGVRAS